ncbi:MAG: hypothetical protein KA125_13300, partial [Chromatiaceae bacterium]|nr:hypothetical protein [Chromatiaceae bacterium]
MSLFLRLLGEEHKGAGLEAAIRSVAAGELDGRVFVVEPDSFEQVPGAPFAYWVSEATRRVFQALPAFEQGDRYARRGPSTCDDFRYLRLWFEAPAEREHGLGLWCDFSKGGAYSP